MQRKVDLIAEAYSKNTLGEYVATETRRTVWADIRSVSGNAWTDAGTSGIKASFEAYMPSVNYKGEKLIEFGGVRYGIYRTYERNGTIDLYLEEQEGVTNG